MNRALDSDFDLDLDSDHFLDDWRFYGFNLIQFHLQRELFSSEECSKLPIHRNESDFPFLVVTCSSAWIPVICLKMTDLVCSYVLDYIINVVSTSFAVVYPVYKTVWWFLNNNQHCIFQLVKQSSWLHDYQAIRPKILTVGILISQWIHKL